MARSKVAEGIFYDSKRKVFYVSFIYGKDGEGKYIRKFKTYHTLKEAKEARREFLAHKEQNELVTPENGNLGDVVEEWLATIAKPRVAYTTYYGYEQIVRNHILKDKISKLPMEDVRARDIQQYYARMLRRVSTNTVIKHRDLLRSVFDYAVRMQYAYRNYVDETIPPTKARREPSVYTPEQLQALFEAVRGTWMEVVVYIAAYLGLRREEIAGLKWKSVDFNSGTILVCDARTAAGSVIVDKDTKTTSSYRKLQMPDTLREVLLAELRKQEEWRKVFGTEYHDSGYVVQHEDGRPRRPNYLSAKFKDIIDKNKLPHITLHGLRHTFASLANQSGATLFDTSKALGHSSPDITGRIYTHMLTRVQSTSVNGVSRQIDIRKRGAR